MDNHSPVSITFSVHSEHGLFVSRWMGKLTDGDLLQRYRDLFEMPTWQPGLNELVDTRGADLSDVSVAALHALAATVEAELSGLGIEMKTAVIASEDLPFGLARLYGTVAAESPESVGVFRDVAPALAWLGAPADLLE